MTDVETMGGITVGQRYALTIGSAEVTGFYEEDEIQKVRFILTPMSSTDDATLLTNFGESIASTAIERFNAWLAEYETEQQRRSVLQSRRARRRTA
jgi:hypothetical protein